MKEERKYIFENPLSPREKEVLWLTGAGFKNREIILELDIRFRTVVNHLVNARRKLRAMGVLQLDNRFGVSCGSYNNPLSVYSAGLAAEHGLIKPLPEKRRAYVEVAKIQLFGIKD